MGRHEIMSEVKLARSCAKDCADRYIIDIKHNAKDDVKFVIFVAQGVSLGIQQFREKCVGLRMYFDIS